MHWEPMQGSSIELLLINDDEDLQSWLPAKNAITLTKI